ncbi:MAG: hypothetical protein ACI8P3_004376 [Saprospiraceae bacterium]|jgi:hypothetical protein
MTQTENKSLDPKLEKRLKMLDKKLNQLLEELKYYSEAQLNRKPGKGKWSAIQVMHHLLLAETGSFNYLQKKLGYNAELRNAGIQSWFRKQGLKFFLWAPFKWKAPPKIGDEYLPVHAGFWDTAKLWIEQRNQLKSYLATLPPDVFKKEAYNHPRAGRMDINGMVGFFDQHFDRHHKQIRGIVKDYTKQI